MSRSGLAVTLLAALLAGCASTNSPSPTLARSPAMMEMHAHPPVTTFSL